MRAAFASDRVGDLLAAAQVDLRSSIATRARPITGVSTYPDLDELTPAREPPDVGALRSRIVAGCPPTSGSPDPTQLLERLASAAASPVRDGSVFQMAVEAAAAGASVAQITTALRGYAMASRIAPLLAGREGEMYERLRDASDRWLARHGRRPQALIVTLGPVDDHRRRAAFVRNLLSAGGIEGVPSGPSASLAEATQATSATDTVAVVVCGSDASYSEIVPGLARALKQRGTRRVLLAGRPGEDQDALRAAGIDRFLFDGCDVYGALEDLLVAAEVLP